MTDKEEDEGAPDFAARLAEEESGELSRSAREAGVSHDYFLLWDVATRCNELAEAVGDESLRFRTGLTVALVVERIEEVIEQARAARSAGQETA